MYSNSTAWFSGSQLRVHLDIQVGEHAIDYANVAQKEKLTELQLRIRQLLDQVDQITKEQNYQRVTNKNPFERQTVINLSISFAVPRGKVSPNKRQHKPAGSMVVASADPGPRNYGTVANETSEELL